MIITEVDVVLFAWDGIETAPYHGPAEVRTSSDLGLLRIRTDDGAEGNAFLGSAFNPASMDVQLLMRWLKPILLGKNPLAREILHGEMRKVSRVANHRTIGAVDVALWDLAGKVAGLPIHALLGGSGAAVPAYASSELHPTVEAYVDQALRLKAQGWRGYKIHAPRDPQLDIEVCAAVREAVGNNYFLTLDSTWAYDYVDAVRVGHAIGELGFAWFEDPLADTDLYNYVKLREKVDVPLMATEYPAQFLGAYPIWVTERATDFLRADVPNKGGITTMLKVAHLAEAFALRFEVHHSGNSLNNVANIHVASALPNSENFEVLMPDGANKYGLVQDLEIDESGLIAPPSGAGLGVEIDLDLVASRQLAIIS